MRPKASLTLAGVMTATTGDPAKSIRNASVTAGPSIESWVRLSKSAMSTGSRSLRTPVESSVAAWGLIARNARRPAAVSPSTAVAMAAAISRRRGNPGHPRGRVDGARIAEGASAVIACANCATLLKRSAGTKAIARVIASSTVAGTLGRTTRSDGGECAKRFEMIACAVGPVKESSPASISYSTQPRA